MTPEQFVYWLQGTMEVLDPKTLNEKQVQIIKDHLDLVFDKQTPDRSKDPVEEKPFKIKDMINDPNTFQWPQHKCTCGEINNIACPLHGWGGLGDTTIIC